jgi:hypothetical protein
VVHQIFHRLRADGAFLAGFLDAGQKFFAGKFLMPPVALEHHQAFVLQFLVGREAVVAFSHSRRRRMVAPSREARESMTLSS